MSRVTPSSSHDYTGYLKDLKALGPTDRITTARERIFTEKRYLTIEQALIITETYKQHEGESRILQRAYALAEALERLEIRIDPEELIVGNRTAGIRYGVVSPEAGIEWVDQELETFPTREQDQFNVREEDKEIFRNEILPYWKGKGLRDEIERADGKQIKLLEKVAKINQKDHAQGHICPDVEKWLEVGPSGLKEACRQKLLTETDRAKKDFYIALILVLDGTITFIERYEKLALDMAGKSEYSDVAEDLKLVAANCRRLKDTPPETYHEALQSVWFLFVVMHMESNANSFSPGRMDQYLYPYFEKEFSGGTLSLERALELTDAFYIKLNHIVYMRNKYSAQYFAGFTTGFNVALGGLLPDGSDGTNLLSFIFLKAQEHVQLAQPNLSVRLHDGAPDDFVNESSRIISLGTGMPQVFNDESIIPALQRQGVADEHAKDYAIVGCVELTTPGNNLGWSDAAMFNILKVLELTMNNGYCLLTGDLLGLQTGYLYDYGTYAELEEAFRKQLDYFIARMHESSMVVDRMHAEVLPSPFLSSVISDCIEKGMDVTAGGAHYNYSGIQVIQVANIADCLAALKVGVYEDRLVDANELLKALKDNYEHDEPLRQMLINKIRKFGNDHSEIDELANHWITYIEQKIGALKNVRGGKYQVGLYTVSAHVPMGLNVGATPDGRKAREPLADGGMSPVYGRDLLGPTAVLKSVSRVNSLLGSNGTLLNMKFTPDFFKTDEDIAKFSSFLRTFVKLHINHIQFNVITEKDLLNAQKHPEKYQNLLVRVAGYTAYFTELAKDLQNEIIQRTTHGEL